MTLTQISSRGVEDTLRWSLGASGTDHYTFTGPGLTGTVNDPTIYLSRGQTYIFENNNSSNAHPFQIQSTSGQGGTAYNTGVTNNGGGGGTEIKITVPHDAPDNLYYQCTAHANMGGTIFITGAVANGSITSAKIADATIVAGDLADDAVTSPKIADNPSFSGTSGIRVPIGTTAQRVNTEGILRYNSENDLLEFYNGTDWKIIDTPPAISSISPTEVASAAGGNVTFTINGSRFASGATVKFISSTGTEITASTVTVVSSTQITAVAAKSSFVNAQEPYDVKVTNASGLSITFDNQIDVDNDPAWVTSSGSLGSFGNYSSVNVTVSATDADGDTVAYSVQSGSLPSGLTLNTSTGAITGTIPTVSSSTTSSFTLRATSNGKTADRAFSITASGPTAHAFTFTGSPQTWTKPAGVTTLNAYVWGAGGGGGGDTGNGGENGGAGGFSSAAINVSSLSNLYLVVGDGGEAGGTSDYNTGGGGGLTGIFSSSSITQGNVVLLSGGGGGGVSGGSSGGGGGGGGGANQSGGDGIPDSRTSQRTQGLGGTTSAGGAAANASISGSYTYHNPQAGGAFYGGRSSANNNAATLRAAAYKGGGRPYTDGNIGYSGGGSGGSGYYGGGGGINGYAGGGGGGSGYANTSLATNITANTGSTGGQNASQSNIAAPANTNTYYSSGKGEGGAAAGNPTDGGDGYIVLVY